MVAKLTNGLITPASPPASLTTPASNSPSLVNAYTTSSTTGLAYFTNSPGNWTQDVCTATPVNSNAAPVTCTSASSPCAFTGLTPGEQHAACSRSQICAVMG